MDITKPVEKKLHRNTFLFPGAEMECGTLNQQTISGGKNDPI